MSMVGITRMWSAEVTSVIIPNGWCLELSTLSIVHWRRKKTQNHFSCISRAH